MSTFITIKTIRKILLALICCFIAEAVSASTISFSDNELLDVKLSDTNINNIIVSNDKITELFCPVNACTSKNDPSGSVYVSLLTKNPFMMFVTTANKHHVSLAVTPTDSIGKTLVLNSLSANPKAKVWETTSSYRTLLITLVRDMMNSKTPDGYGFTPITNAHPQKIFHGAGVMTLQAVWSGNYLVGEAYQFRNLSKKTLVLAESAFYHNGVRLVATTDQKVHAGSSEVVYEILSRN